MTIYSDSSYLVNCMRRGWHKRWRENGGLNHRNEPVANRDLWERLLEATQRHQEVRWRKVKGHSKTEGQHKSGNDRADELAVAAKKEAKQLPVQNHSEATVFLIALARESERCHASVSDTTRNAIRCNTGLAAKHTRGYFPLEILFQEGGSE